MRGIVRNIGLSILIMSGLATTPVLAEEVKQSNTVTEIEETIRLNRQEDISEQLKKYFTKDMTEEEAKNVTVKYTITSESELQEEMLVEIYKGGTEEKNLVPTATKKVMVRFVESAPVIKLKRDSVVVNNGDPFNPNSYISYINTDSNILPALEIKSNVDTSVDGEYTVNYKATDLKGQVTERTLNVTVKTHQEVLEKQEQERIAEEERIEQERLEQERQQSLLQRSLYHAPVQNISYAATGNEAVDRAMAYIGYSYIWGSNNPANGGFDCSGLVQYCYGIGARTTYDQRNLGTHRYDVWNAPAGALYFYNNDSHVSIATGNGGTVQAMNESVGVTTQSISSWMPDYYVVIGQ